MNRIAPLAVVVSAVLLATTACTAAGHGSTATPTSTSASLGSLDAETLAYLAENAKGFAEQLGIVDPPDIQPVRLISLNEWASTHIACLNEEGFEVTESPDGEGVNYPQLTDPALKQSLNLGIYTCEMKYPTQLKYLTPLSTDALKRLYTYRSGELLKCLDEQGYTVTDLPPSETVFVQSNGEWTPYRYLSIARVDLKRVFSTCPQAPDWIYGD